MRKSLSTRRLFLQRGLALLAAAPTIPTFLDQTMMAMADPLMVTRSYVSVPAEPLVLETP